MPVRERRRGPRRNFVGATLRCALSLGAITILPYGVPSLAAYMPVFVLYGVLGIAMLWLIALEKVQTFRWIVGGAADLLIITLIVHHTGYAYTGFVSMYLVLTVVYATVTTPRVGGGIAIGALVSYTCIVVAERSGWIAHAPGAPDWMANHPPSDLHGAVGIASVFVVLFVSSLCFIAIAHQVQATEATLLDLNERLAEETRTDPLTGLWNRRHVESELARGLAWFKRGRPLVVVVIDLDNFKTVNDTLGHLAGDQLLVQVAAAIRGCTRDVDTAGRTGGDEFVLLLQDADQVQASVVGTRLVDAIREVGRDVGEGCSVTASVGVASVQEGDSAHSVLERADQFAYEAKGKGGDCLRG